MEDDQLLQYKNIYDNNPFGFCILQAIRDKHRRVKDCVIDYINPAMAQSFGAAPANIIGRKYRNIFPQDINKLIPEFFDRIDHNDHGIFFYHAKYTDRYYNIQYHIMPGDRCSCFVTDVSEREKEHNEQMQQLYLSSSITIIWSYNIKEDRYEDYQSLKDVLIVRNEKIAGYEDLIAQGFINQDSIETLRTVHREIERGSTKNTVIIHMNPEKSTVEWMRATYTTVNDENGKPMTIVAVGENITEYRKNMCRYDEELRNKDAVRSKNLVIKARYNISQNIVEIYDAKNGYGILRAGMSYDTAVDLLAKSVISGEQQQYFSSILNRGKILRDYSKGNNQYSLEYQRSFKSGQIRWLNTIIRTYQDYDNGDIKAYIYSYDIDEERTSKEIVERIVDLEFEFLGLISINSGLSRSICKTDWDLNHNKSDELDYEKGVSEFARMYIPDTKRADFINNVNLDNIIMQLEKGDMFTFMSPVVINEVTAQKKWVYAYLDDTHNNIIHIRSDVTEIVEHQEKQKEILREALEETKKASKAKSDFLARMSHDIRTPMNAIIGMTQLALDEENSSLIRDYLCKIDISSQFLLSLINDILDMNTIENGNITLNYQPYACDDFRDYIESVFRPICNEKKINFIVNLDALKGIRLISDRLRINQIFLNLMSNAVKFTPEGGKVEILAENLHINDNLAEFEIAIKDNGIGMSEDFQKYMFEPFSQERKDACQNIKGTGLGLSIVKRLAELLGGTILVKSQLGIGSEFRLHFKRPVLTGIGGQDDDRDYNTMLQNCSLYGYKVLICEDHPMNMEIVCRLLEKEGIIPIMAENGEIGVNSFADSEEYDINAILMDIHMPVMNGLEATKIIRKMNRPDARTIPIIAMTANAFDEDVKATIAAGMNEHLTKPYNPKELIKILKLYICFRKRDE